MRALRLAGAGLVALIAVAVSACSSPSPHVTPAATITAGATVTVTPTPDAGQPCSADDLRAAVVPDRFQDYQESIYYFDLVLTNTGTVSCTVNGYPSVAFVAAGKVPSTGTPGADTQVGAAATDTGSPQATGKALTLSPGGAAAVALAWNQASVFGATPGCTGSYADGFRIVPPGASSALFAAEPSLPVCATDSSSVLTVGAFSHA